MALLRNVRSRRTTPLVVAALALLGGCVLLEHLVGGEPPLAFSHRVHYEQEGLDCIACHASYETDDDPGMPVRAQCMLCHEGLDEEQPPERRIDTLFDGDVYRARRISRLDDEVIFSHAAHALDPELCGTCHTGIETSDRLDASMAVSMDDCMACHDTLGIANDCATCHSEIREDLPPPSHHDNWTKVHGKVYRGHFDGVANRCDLCHEESSCNSCHFEEMPESHNNHWRRRGHGITARMDRTSCMVCHDTDSCDRCHRENAPINHVGMWGNPVNQHCLSCHITTSSGGCFVCHEGAPSHALATPQPPSHAPGMNCLQCHGISAPLPHVNKGDDCTICHQ